MSTRATLKSFFETGDKPTQAQFYDLIDSLFHKTEDSVNWTEIAGKPTTFVPSEHTHAWTDLTGVPTTFAPSAHTHAWADITGKPTTFAPSAHVHSAGEITTGLFHPSRIGAGATTDGYIVQMVAGVPTWVVAPSGGGSTPPAGSTGQVQYNGGGVFAGSSSFFWDNTNSRLGIGNSSPSYSLDVNGTARVVTVPTITTATKMLVKDPTTGQMSEQLISSGGIGWSLSGSATSGTDKLGSTNTYVNLLANGSDYGQFGAATGSLRIGNATQGTAQSRNTIVGDFGGGGGMGGSDNAVFGRLALYQSSGIGHSAFGQGAGYCITPITGNYLSFFGFETQALSAGLSNSTAIGANAQIAESNTVVLGNPACGTIVGGNTIHSSLKFVVESTTKAARLPIMSKTQMNAISTPTKGAELYLNDDNGKMWYDGTRWTGFRYNGTKFQGYDGTSWLDLN